MLISAKKVIKIMIIIIFRFPPGMTADELAAMEAKAIAVCDADGSGCVTWAEVDQCEHDHVSCFRYLWYLIKVSTKFREIF